jgi:type IV secretory pathway VirB10-like protein
VLTQEEIETFNFTITAQSKESLEFLSTTLSVGVFVFQGNAISIPSEFYILLAFFGILALIWIASIRYFVRKRRAEAKEEEEGLEVPSKRKFVKVAPKEPVAPAKKGKGEREVPAEVEKAPKKDFDEILREVKGERSEEEEEEPSGEAEEETSAEEEEESEESWKVPAAKSLPKKPAAESKKGKAKKEKTPVKKEKAPNKKEKAPEQAQKPAKKDFDEILREVEKGNKEDEEDSDEDTW